MPTTGTSSKPAPGRSARFLSGLYLFLVSYVIIAILLYVVAVASLQAQRPLGIYPFSAYQHHFYFRAGRQIWQYLPDCVTIDEALVYRPRTGRCEFSSFEFSTTMHFDEFGRAVPAREALAKPWQRGVAILGDSHAMGWGVEDADTFANVLQRNIDRPVFNLAVSSYGTERELRRLQESGLAGQLDTIVIQYCNNDIGENRASPPAATLRERARQHAELLQRDRAGGAWERFRLILSLVWAAVRTPPRDLKEFLRGNPGQALDFEPHLSQLRSTLKKYDHLLRGKRVIVTYSNEWGRRFRDFPSGPDAELPNVTWLDAGLARGDYFQVDDHPNIRGHQKMGNALARALGTGL